MVLSNFIVSYFYFRPVVAAILWLKQRDKRPSSVALKWRVTLPYSTYKQQMVLDGLLEVSLLGQLPQRGPRDLSRPQGASLPCLAMLTLTVVQKLVNFLTNACTRLLP